MDITTDRLRVRDLASDDLDAMVRLWTDPVVARFMGTFGPRTAEATAEWLEVTIGHNRVRPRVSHNAAVIVADTGTCVGWIGCGTSSEPVGDYDFGYALLPEHRGQGYAREALTGMLDFCFDELGCGSVWGQCSPENPKSEAVMRGADMNPAGTAPNGQRRFRTERAPLS